MIPGHHKFQRGINWFGRRFMPGGLILMYHRVADLSPDPFHIGVAPQHFAEHLEVLKRYTHLVSLPQLVQAVREKKSIDRWVALTFDDGYADNLYTVKPLLERYNIPATFFITTGDLENKREFWWDELERLLLQPGTLPPVLSLKLKDRTYEWNLDRAACYSQSNYLRDRHWTWYDRESSDPSSRQQLYRNLYLLLSQQNVTDRQNIMDRLLDWSGAKNQVRATHRSLSAQELHHLAPEALIEIGAHTVHHPFLSVLSATEQQQELQQNKAQLEALLERPVISFAYPHGNYSSQTPAIAQAVGFNCACTTRGDRVRLTTDTFQLPRVEAHKGDGEVFSKQLAQFILPK
ncbi:MAG: polysaccharide deacetylase family protein [Chroococcus sp. CMT-3BRIN-NPC107]|nr:polysaccharide deacetylase family protein [Chroococcus sp. CMT-3BRIN-NPC107]